MSRECKQCLKALEKENVQMRQENAQMKLAIHKLKENDVRVSSENHDLEKRAQHTERELTKAYDQHHE